ncbi:uncharacterized protein TRAVEDRAFT_112059 [Trametes versicolor FP-101664 SS1]|uniref:uncharacterized protein n=1 Tax=Trametes versicolor (strain FP-101664) TaxID=717944 RepID=UPI0004623480|nr:uncharacterized protein TRAVEDRAFT_112059 [Trametes versicolor FP-101664 SS1]EIW64650.1 hypothetical protein TRAVEDRAFT_112059 [Trametes versicolor FP-101664 SS1]
MNNQALQLQRQGDFQAAERVYLQAIQVKEAGLGTEHFTTAVSYNGLGELYLKMDRLDEAGEYLNKALRIRSVSGPKVDLAYTRDNLGRLHEMRGDLEAAQDIRLQGAPEDNIACSNYACANLSNKLSALSQCTVCKAIYYCSKPCQMADWKRHKKFCRRVDGSATKA